MQKCTSTKMTFHFLDLHPFLAISRRGKYIITVAGIFHWNVRR